MLDRNLSLENFKTPGSIERGKATLLLINKNESLMNVAVSRAKDAFWVFGARKCLDERGNSSSALLKKYIYKEIE